MDRELKKNAWLWIVGLLILAVTFQVEAGISPAPTGAASESKARLVETYGKLPLSFEINQGQTSDQVRFLSRGPGYSVFLTPTEAVLSLQASEVKEQGQSPHGATKRTSERALLPSAGQPQKPSLASQGTIGERVNTDHKTQPRSVLRMQLVGANPKPQISGADALPAKVNYFHGKDPNQWRTNIPTYAKVKYENVYPGIDLVYYGNQRQLEHDFVVAPSADPETIKLTFAGADKLNVDAQGDLVLRTSGSEVRLRKPFVYQEISGKRREIEGHYMLHTAKGNENVQVGFRVPAYDKSKPLVIDPVLVYSTYLGGSNSEAFCGAIVGIAVDSQGNAYVAGSTASLDFPTTAGAFDTTHNPFGDFGYTDAFVAKLNAEGSALVYATYLGGNIQAASTCGTDIAVDNQGSAYVVGTTGAGVFNFDFPTTPGAFDTEYGPNSRIEVDDGFVTKLDSTGSSLLYSTFLGGGWYDELLSIAVDNNGDAYITGWTGSGDFPVTPGAFAPEFGGDAADGFVTKVNNTGSALIYSTYLGGINFDLGNDITVDDTGNAYVAGRSGSPDFPATPGAFDTSFNQVHAGFITKLNSTGSALVYSTFLGGSSGGNELFGIALDGTGNAYATGTTNQNDFPTTPGAFNTSINGTSGAPDATVSKLNASGTALIYSTYLGGSDGDNGSGISVDTAGNASVTGNTCSTDFPTQNPLQAANAGDCDAFVAKLDSTGSSLIYATYLGGSIGFPGQSAFDSGSSIAVDSVSDVYVVGITASSDFPITPGALNTSNNGNVDAFVVKISDTAPPPPQPVLSVTPASLDFGTVAVGSSKDLEFTVTNMGEGTLIGTASTSAPFSIVSGGSYSLSAGTSQTVVVRFAPTAPGSFTGNVSFASNGGDTSQGVTGIGDPAPALSVTPTTMDFGSVPVGSSSDRTVTIENTGGGVLSGTCSTTVPFSLPDGCSFNLASGQTKVVAVRFSPMAVGTFSELVNLSSSGGNTSLSVQGTGTASAPVSILSIDPTSGPAGTSVLIRGQRFGNTQNTSFVSFGSQRASITSWSNTQITAIAPPGLTGSVPVTVNTVRGTSNSVTFSYVNPVTLSVERPPLLERQDFIRLGRFTPQLELEFLDVAKSELFRLDDNAVPGDECYLGAVDAVAVQQARRFVEISLGKLAADIFSASISVITTGARIGDYLLKFSAEMINSAVLNVPLDETLLVFVTEKTAGYVAGQVTESFILGETVSALTKRTIRQLLDADDPIVWELSGSNQGTDAQRSGVAPLTNIRAELFYNPFTHYTTALIGATCNLQSGTRTALYIQRYKVAKTAFNSAEIVDGTLRVDVRQLQ